MQYSFLKKNRNVGRISFLFNSGNLTKRLIGYVRYKLKEQWDFVYFEMPLDESLHSFKISDNINIRPATQKDIARIESEIYPVLSGYGESDKKYISRIGQKGFWCFIAEKEDRLIHYFLVFEKALESPLTKTPFNKMQIHSTDAYLGSAFTIPQVRGVWIFSYSLAKICEYLKHETNATRAILLVHNKTPGAVVFYKRLGFKAIENAAPAGPVNAFKIKLSALLIPKSSYKNF